VPQHIDQLLAAAREGLNRLEPEAALSAYENGALLVDMRPYEQRVRDGLIPGALVIDRNVLEWRLDPSSLHKLAAVSGYEQQIILICNQGFSSSLAAATLQQLGLRNATDVAGGFEQWAARGLPVSRSSVDAMPAPANAPATGSHGADQQRSRDPG
jgi:rhodanese-related sulfurtransferase